MSVAYEDGPNDQATHMKIDESTKDQTVYRDQSKYFQYCGKACLLPP